MPAYEKHDRAKTWLPLPRRPSPIQPWHIPYRRPSSSCGSRKGGKTAPEYLPPWSSSFFPSLQPQRSVPPHHALPDTYKSERHDLLPRKPQPRRLFVFRSVPDAAPFSPDLRDFYFLYFFVLLRCFLPRFCSSSLIQL